MDTMRLDIRPTAELIAEMDRWRRDQPGLPSRAAAARMLIEIGLDAEAMPAQDVPAKPTTKRNVIPK